MRFSFNWLKHYLSTDLDIVRVAEKLTSIGLEVEKADDPEVIFKNFKLVRIKEVQKHPNADNLQVCTVEDALGNESCIVCGAKNARVGLKTVLAMPGAIIPSSKEVLKKSKIRGVVSEGMMCSFGELGISCEDEGIIEADSDADLASSPADVLGYDGGILEISITPNRGDCFSVRGIARDLAAAGAGKFLLPEEGECTSSFKFPINVNYDNSESCRQYAPFIAFRVIRGVKNGESPKWLKSALKSAGLNSISALVDLSNLWMVDSGRPTHLYDLKKIKGDLHIRFSKNREVFEDIKGNEYRLLPGMLMAADDESSLCLLGIMGGKKAACDENTTDILVESGLFDPIFVSRTGTLLNINSDSRSRFERGIDGDSCISGLNGITKLIIENCGGEAGDILTVGNRPTNNKKITLRKTRLDNISGCSIDWNNAKLLLKKLGLKEVKFKEWESVFLAPGWRSDLNIEEDLIEEILRLEGYDRIPDKSVEIIAAGRDELSDRKMKIIGAKKILASRGLSEVITYSFTKQDYAEAFEEGKKVIKLINPISADYAVMRPSLISTLLQRVASALNYGQTDVAFCESGNTFRDSCEQDFHISGVRIGNFLPRNWLEKTRSVDVFDVKGDVTAVLKYWGADERNITTINSAASYYHPSRSGTVMLGKKKTAYFGELHPKIGDLFNISEKIVCFEIFGDNLPGLIIGKLFDCSKVFPKIVRDFAFLFSSRAEVGNMLNNLCKLDPLITKADIFDCFDLNITQKSIAVSVTMDAVNRTLTEEEAQVVSDKVIRYVESVGGELRKK
ncbi:MAG: phenylalanine--tRNA ligase subunit beta [Holosporaceae bacterium]|jgi:phenylalanyl-tRNA synthetase beta chain|nr:phenylalanine--tRNA ligase subunit beta [Holosporaceae bacterium]